MKLQFKLMLKYAFENPRSYTNLSEVPFRTGDKIKFNLRGVTCLHCAKGQEFVEFTAVKIYKSRGLTGGHYLVKTDLPSDDTLDCAWVYPARKWSKL